METKTKKKRPTAAEIERREAIQSLRRMIKPGATVYTVLRHVSRSGMTRGIDVYFMKNGAPQWITGYVGKAINNPQSLNDWRASKGLRIGGCGMDMGFHVVYSLSEVLYGYGSKAGYKCRGKKCPSNYHTNYRTKIRCERPDGKFCFAPDWPRVPDNWPRFKESIGDGQTIDGGPMYCVTDDDKNPVPCDHCGGRGYLPNPEGPERFDLRHKDGYALKHKWL